VAILDIEGVFWHLIQATNKTIYSIGLDNVKQRSVRVLTEIDNYVTDFMEQSVSREDQVLQFSAHAILHTQSFTVWTSSVICAGNVLFC
jgi:hypothetical protein